MNQKEIAEKLDISQSSLSLVLKDPTCSVISPGKKKDLFDYLSRNAGRHLKSRNKNIGFLVPGRIYDLLNSNDSFYSRFYFGALKKCQENGANLVFLDRQPESVCNPDFLNYGGFVVLHKVDLSQVERLHKSFEVVLLNCEVENSPCDSVMPDYAGSMESVFKYLTGKGHTKIGFYMLKAPGKASSALNLNFNCMMEGFYSAARKHGLNVRKEHIRIFDAVERSMEELNGFSEKVIKSWEKCGFPTAVLTGDGYAVSLMNAAGRLGYSIPRDLSVVGFDNKDFCDIVSPGLTSVSVHMEDMGRASIEMLFKRIGGCSYPPQKLYFGTDIVERGSVRKIG